MPAKGAGAKPPLPVGQCVIRRYGLPFGPS